MSDYKEFKDNLQRNRLFVGF